MTLVRNPASGAALHGSTWEGPSYTPDTLDAGAVYDQATYATSQGRSTPWGVLGSAVDGAMTAAEALERAGLNFTVTAEPIYLADLTPVSNRKANVYTDPQTGKREVLGFTTNAYEVVNSIDAFAFYDRLVGTERHYTAAWSMRGRRQVGVTIHLPEEAIVVDPEGANDRTEMFLLGVNSFDASTGFQVIATGMRLWCLNQVVPALRSAQRSFCRKHSRTIHSDLADAAAARAALGLSIDYRNALQGFADTLYQSRLGPLGFEALLARVLPAPSPPSALVARRYQEKLDRVHAIHASPTCAAIKGTRWGAYQAVTEWAEWERNVRGRTAEDKARNRAVGTMTGWPVGLQTRLAEALLVDA